jgi:soluble lytic murein transglycosylase
MDRSHLTPPTLSAVRTQALRWVAVLAGCVTLCSAFASDPACAQQQPVQRAATSVQPPAAAAAPAAVGPRLVPAPRASEAEVRFIAAMDAAIAPVRDAALGSEDAARLKEAAQAYAANDRVKGDAAAAQITDPVTRKLAHFVRLKVGIGEPAEYAGFLEKNPMWPDRALLVQRGEEAIFTAGGNARAIREAFERAEPKTGIGFAALASAQQAEGDAAAARTSAAHAWRTLDIPASFESVFLERFASMLTEADHKWRLDRLIVDDVRWEKDRTERIAAARRLVPRLSAAEQQKAEARIATFARAATAPQLMGALTVDPAADPGFAFHWAQALRRTGRTSEAARLLNSISPDPARVANLDAWWTERRLLAYDLLKAGNPRLAYEVAKISGPVSVNPMKDHAFLAGWLAFRHLGDGKTGEKHFAHLRKIADGPLSLARGDYWIARVAEAQGDGARAAKHYEAASRWIDTFHGQLARQKRSDGASPMVIGLPTAPTGAEVQTFNNLDAVRAAVIARRANLDVGLVRSFLAHLVRQARSEGEAVLVAHLAEALGDTQMAVRTAKLAVGRGFALYNYAYPIHPMPPYNALRAPPETALLLAIARQESEFNTRTMSGAGARGILQVMPITARHVCRDYKIKCEIDRLLTDGSYNATIASAYITDRMGEFQGSYVLTFAGYNAGPGRARQWIGEFGDPRDPKIDPVDWIHRIPFEETREYVQKVLANVQIYRARIGESRPGGIGADLARAKGLHSVAQPRVSAPPAVEENAAAPASSLERPSVPPSLLPPSDR